MVTQNKRVETIVKAMQNTWILCFGISSVGFYADNGGKFVNIKMDELIARFRVTMRYRPEYSPWSNGINKKITNITCDVTIRKIMEGKKE